MKSPVEDAASARRDANTFVRTHIESAQRLLCESCGSDLSRELALFEFGKALHTVQDSTSPAHYGFQTWYGTAHWIRAIRHVRQEAFDPGQGSQLYQATAWLWSFFKCKDSAPTLPSDFFDKFTFDPNPN